MSQVDVNFPPGAFLPAETGKKRVDGVPVGEPAEVVVVDIDVGDDLAGLVGPALEEIALRMVAVDGIEPEAAAGAPVDGIFQQLTVPGGPEDQGMALFLQG